MCALTSTFFMLVLFHLILCHSLSSYIAPSSSLPHFIILYNLLLFMLFPTSSHSLLPPLNVCDILLSYLTFSHLNAPYCPFYFLLLSSHHIWYHFFSSPHSSLIFLSTYSTSSYPLLLHLILSYFIFVSYHHQLSYFLSLLFIIYHFPSSYSHVVLS